MVYYSAGGEVELYFVYIPDQFPLVYYLEYVSTQWGCCFYLK